MPGRTYMPSKPRKYGLKVFWACESNTGFALNAIIYGGRNGDEIHYNLGHDLVMELSEPFYNTGRNICTDNFFTSYQLALNLLQHNLTLLGTIRSHRREIPPLLKVKKPLFESTFLFENTNNITFVSYQSKKNKNVILLSSSHSSTRCSNDEFKKPEMILCYNEEKGGVDMFDENLEEFSCKRKTVRWPMLFFYNMIDTATNNGFLLMKKNGYSKTKKAFLKALSFQLAQPYVRQRLQFRRIKQSVKRTAEEAGFDLPIQRNNNNHQENNNLPRRCISCKKSTRSECNNCRSHVCPNHRVISKIVSCLHCRI